MAELRVALGYGCRKSCFESGHRDPQLPDGTPVQVSVRPGTAGTPTAVLEATSKPPYLTTEDVAELLQEIEHGKRPVQFDSPLS